MSVARLAIASGLIELPWIVVLPAEFSVRESDDLAMASDRDYLAAVKPNSTVLLVTAPRVSVTVKNQAVAPAGGASAVTTPSATVAVTVGCDPKRCQLATTC